MEPRRRHCSHAITRAGGAASRFGPARVSAAGDAAFACRTSLIETPTAAPARALWRRRLHAHRQQLIDGLAEDAVAIARCTLRTAKYHKQPRRALSTAEIPRQPQQVLEAPPATDRLHEGVVPHALVVRPDAVGEILRNLPSALRWLAQCNCAHAQITHVRPELSGQKSIVRTAGIEQYHAPIVPLQPIRMM